MAWLQKRPQVSIPTVYYSSGLNTTILLVGLGNPGQEYLSTRHNVGFNCLDNFTKAIEEFGDWSVKKDLKCQLNQAQMGDKRVLIIKPTTFMNNSGEAVAAVANFYKIASKSILVIHDELDIEFGQIRTRIGGADAGHNGIKSITETLSSENYGRVRIGIGPKKPLQMDSKDFVLASFSKDEKKQLPHLYKEVNALLSEYIYGSTELRAETRSFIV